MKLSEAERLYEEAKAECVVACDAYDIALTRLRDAQNRRVKAELALSQARPLSEREKDVLAAMTSRGEVRYPSWGLADEYEFAAMDLVDKHFADVVDDGCGDVVYTITEAGRAKLEDVE